MREEPGDPEELKEQILGHWWGEELLGVVEGRCPGDKNSRDSDFELYPKGANLHQ